MASENSKQGGGKRVRVERMRAWGVGKVLNSVRLHNNRNKKIYYLQRGIELKTLVLLLFFGLSVCWCVVCSQLLDDCKIYNIFHRKI